MLGVVLLKRLFLLTGVHISSVCLLMANLVLSFLTKYEQNKICDSCGNLPSAVRKLVSANSSLLGVVLFEPSKAIRKVGWCSLCFVKIEDLCFFLSKRCLLCDFLSVTYLTQAPCSLDRLVRLA